jgi:hypothetical protein
MSAYDDDNDFDDLLVLLLDPTPLVMCHTLTMSSTLLTLRACIRLRRSIRTRTYMTRRAVPQPRECHAARVLYNSADDKSMIAVTGFDRPTFDYIHQHFAPIYGAPSSTGRPRMLNTRTALMLVLKYLSSTVDIHSLVQLHGICPATTYNALDKSKRALVVALRQMREGRIQWPSANEMQHLARLVNDKYPAINGCFGFIDGCRLRVLAPADSAPRIAFLSKKVSFASVNNVYVFQADGVICWASINVPGATHDRLICDPVFNLLRHQTGQNFNILGDKGFVLPPQHHDIAHKLITPLRAGDYISNVPRQQLVQLTMNAIIVRACTTVEWGMHAIRLLVRAPNLV